MLQPCMLFVLLTVMSVAAVSASGDVVDDLKNGDTYVDLDTTVINNQLERRTRSVSTALRRIWNKAVHIIRIKDEQRSTYLLVRGVRDDALNDFQSFQPKQTWIDNYDKGALVGQLGIKDVAEVRLISTKGRSLPVIEIWKFNDSGVDHSLTSVIYCDSIDQMENVYNFIKKHKHPDFK